MYTRKIKSIALLMSLTLVFLLSGCLMQNKNTDKLPMAKWEGNTFVSEWAEFKFTIPDGWYKASNKEISEFYEVESNAIAGVTDDEPEKYHNASGVYPFFVTEYPMNNIPDNVIFNTNVVAVFEKLSALSNLVVKDAKTYLESVASQLEESGFETEMGKSREIAGHQYELLITSIQGDGFVIKQRYYARKNDKHMVCLIFSSLDNEESKIEELLTRFEKDGKGTG